MIRTLDSLAAFWAVLGGLVLGAIVLVTALNAALFSADKLAGFFGANVAGISGYEDFVRLAVSAAGPMFLPWCQARRGHVRVELFERRMSPAVSRGLARVWLAVMALLALFLLGWMVVGVLETRADGVRSPVLSWPEWPFYLPGLVSLALWAVIAGVQAVLTPDG